MRIVRTLAVAATVVASSLPAAAQVVTTLEQLGPRDRPSIQPRIGTGTVRGRVVDGLTGDAIARARVRLMMPGVTQAVVMSGSDGEFAFTKLPDGSFSARTTASRTEPCALSSVSISPSSTRKPRTLTW